MALVITSSVAINDSTSSYSAVVSGKLVSNARIDFILKINGVAVASVSTTGTSATLTGVLASEIYDNAQGHSLTNAATLEALEDNGLGGVAQSASKSGNITINARCSGLNTTSPTSGSPINLDSVDPVNISASWTRPHAAFRGRLKGYVYNGSTYVLIFNRYDYTTSANFDVVALGYNDEMIAAMNGVSPRNFKLELYTQFDDGTADNLDIGGLNDSDIITNGVTKTFVTLSRIAIGNFELLPIDLSVPFTLTTYGSFSHTIRLYLKKTDGTSVLIKTQSVSAGVVSGSFAIGATERSIILNALPTSTYATTYAEVDTASYGTTDSKSVATTLTLNAEFKPVIGSVVHAESASTQYVKTALGYGAGTPFYVTSKSKVAFTIPITHATGATLAMIRVQFAGTDKSQAASPLTTDALVTAGSLMATITVTDSRGRISTLTTAAIVVRSYTYPKVDKFEVFRAASVSGAFDPLGTYFRAVIQGTAYSVLALDGVTQKNWIKYKIDYRVKNTGSYSNNAAVTPGGLTFGELTINGIAGFLAENAYDVRIRVYDAFYDLDNDASTLEDTDDYAETLTLLQIAGVSMFLGPDYVAFGKVHSGGVNNTIEALKAIVAGTQLVSQQETGTPPLVVASTTQVPNLNVDRLDNYHAGNASGQIPLSNGTKNVNLNADLLDGFEGVDLQDILAVGSSGTHYWIKFKDGTLIKYGVGSVTMAISTGWGSGYSSAEQTYTFNTTIPFTSVPHVSLDLTNSGGSTIIATVTNVTSLLFKFVGLRFSTLASGAIAYRYFAIGRWN